jgi:hypothetical protein
VVVTTVLSAIFLKERLSFVGKVGCFNCIIGSIVIVMNAPDQSSVKDIQGMQYYVLSPGFLVYAGLVIVGCAFIAFWVGPRYGKKSMLVYLSICSLVGGLSVVATQGLGAAIVAQIGGEEQYKHWFFWFLLVFVVCTLLTEIVYLNVSMYAKCDSNEADWRQKALNIFNAALVTPTYYVYFTSATLVTSCILFRGLHGATVSQIITIILGFLQICSGVVLLQLSKSSKDVPDAAVFSGDLDQIRTVAQVEEPESEPHADTIRGVAGLVRSLSTTRQHREMEEVKRIHEETLEPIAEDEQVVFDGLRRRKTVISLANSGSVRTVVRKKSMHYPLGMSHFPHEDDRASAQDDEHNPEDDFGIFPRLGRRAQTAFSSITPRRSLNRSPDPHSPRHATTVPLTQMRHNIIAHDFASPKHANSYTDLSPSPERPSTPSGRTHVFGLPPDHQRSDSLGVPGQDTSYRSPASSTLTWAPTPSQLPPLSPYNPGLPQPRSQLGQSNLRYGSPERQYTPTPAPPPPAHSASHSTDSRGRRQFSFQTIFGGKREHSFERSKDVSRSRSRSKDRNRTSNHSTHSGFSRRSRPKTITEEERMGLVHAGSDAAAPDEVDQEISRTRFGRIDDGDVSDAGSVLVTPGASVRRGVPGLDTDDEDDGEQDEFGLARQQTGSGYARVVNTRSPASVSALRREQRDSRGGRLGRHDDLDDDDIGGRAFV